LTQLIKRVVLVGAGGEANITEKEEGGEKKRGWAISEASPLHPKVQERWQGGRGGGKKKKSREKKKNHAGKGGGKKGRKKGKKKKNPG